MSLDSTLLAITYALTHRVDTTDEGTQDTKLRERALRFLQRVVEIYWELPWKHREQDAALEFDADGQADLPTNFMCFDRDSGYIVFTDPNRVITPTHADAREVRSVMANRENFPDRSGPVIQVVLYGGIHLNGDGDRVRTLYRWPTKPPSPPEAATLYYHRNRPELVDSDAEDTADEWFLIPDEDRYEIVEAMMAMWGAQSGDGRADADMAKARKRFAELFALRNLDNQPRKWGRPFVQPSSLGRQRIGDRYLR